MQLARELAAAWVRGTVSARRDVVGAFFSGSTVEMKPSDSLPVASDVDVVLVLEASQIPAKPGKLRHGGVLIEVTYLSRDDLADPQVVAETYVLAPSFARDTIIYDPTGLLRRVHQRVSARFADPELVQRRVDGVRAKSLSGLVGLGSSSPWHEQVNAWLFSSSLATHAVLVAGLRNPTVRLRFLAARQVLTAHRLDDFYPRLLSLNGCAGTTAAATQHHLDELARSFDLAAEVARTPFFFSSDITAEARPIAIDGSQQLIDSGNHREAVFWIMATFARCRQILTADAPDAEETFEQAYAAAAEDLCGVRTSADLRAGAARARQEWPAVMAVCRHIIGR